MCHQEGPYNGHMLDFGRVFGCDEEASLHTDQFKTIIGSTRVREEGKGTQNRTITISVSDVMKTWPVPAFLASTRKKLRKTRPAWGTEETTGSHRNRNP